jgi:hypothetical protein
MYLHIASGRNYERFNETNMFVEYAKQNGFPFVKLDALEDYSYSKKLIELWNKDDIMIIEEDKVPTLDILHELEICHHPFCSQSYIVTFKVGDGIKTYSAGGWNRVSSGVGSFYHIPWCFTNYPDKTKIFTDTTDLGLVKISKSLQEKIKLQVCKFDVQQFRISEELTRLGVKVHIHLPTIKHNHIINLTEYPHYINMVNYDQNKM